MSVGWWGVAEKIRGSLVYHDLGMKFGVLVEDMLVYQLVFKFLNLDNYEKS